MRTLAWPPSRASHPPTVAEPAAAPWQAEGAGAGEAVKPRQVKQQQQKKSKKHGLPGRPVEENRPGGRPIKPANHAMVAAKGRALKPVWSGPVNPKAAQETGNPSERTGP